MFGTRLIEKNKKPQKFRDNKEQTQGSKKPKPNREPRYQDTPSEFHDDDRSYEHENRR
jgi:hypothetical protein